ncbi:MAG TPA: DsbA family protein [Thermoplasmata archaeon]|nr:DsbA family protein [Thermoplasmata archaeon]
MAPAIATAIETGSTPRAAPGRVQVTWFTDPINVWCWGCEPAIRRLQVRYAATVEVGVVMGGLFEDFGPILEYWSRMSGGRWQDSVRAFLDAVGAHHRMPMDVSRMMVSLDDLKSTWPSCIAVKAAGLQGKGREYPYLRHYREAMYLEGRKTTTRAVQIELAAELGLNAEAFIRALDDGSAEAAFHADLDTCRSKSVTGFPTFELRRDPATARLDGWQPWDAFDEALQEFAPDVYPTPLDATTENVQTLLRRFERCATLEVAAILGVTDDEAEILLEDLEVQGAVRRREVGTGLIWEVARGPRKDVGLQTEGAAEH